MNRLGRSSLVLLQVLPSLAVEGQPEPAPSASLSREGRIGVFVTSVVTSQAATSHDPTIASSSDTTSWQSKGEGRWNWKREADSWENTLNLAYGRQFTDAGGWRENEDQIRIASVFGHAISGPHGIYAAAGIDSVFTGGQEQEHPLDPLTGRLSSGYRYRRESVLPKEWLFDGRLGIRLQRTWGSGLSEEQREWEIGPELVLRGEWQPDERLSGWLQYEAFSEFSDPGHATNLLTAALLCKLSTVLTVDLSLRAYYETTPSGAGADRTGYNELSLRQMTLLGLSYVF